MYKGFISCRRFRKTVAVRVFERAWGGGLRLLLSDQQFSVGTFPTHWLRFSQGKTLITLKKLPRGVPQHIFS